MRYPGLLNTKSQDDARIPSPLMREGEDEDGRPG